MRHDRISADRRTPRPSFEDPDGVLPPESGAEAGASTKEQDSKKPVAWKDMPQKRQLAILTLSRLSEPLVQTSLQVSFLPRST
ncbi:hypothetical protein NQ176_g11065 [Zarea fungicola]|uniref:Uncharacterized protein n=1 Tax=Zarea fungicola TaxID=93591 RepID=A0ACC1MEF1_9HYPO|nr:hypothetical protein NQ176_g11065 [Lecanicillium fungicola]